MNGPERHFEVVEVETAVNQPFGDITTLIGLNVDPDSSEVTLIWQSDRETPISYRVFVHLLDETDTIVSQSDGEPVTWHRPTTGWLPGEILQDKHQLTFPSDDSSDSYRLRIGLYDPETGQRLPTETGDSVSVSIP